jgi:SAM-dependent methyltransferase
VLRLRRGENRRFPGIKTAFRWPYLAVGDARRAIGGDRDPLTPPRRLQLPGWRGDFRRGGDKWRRVMDEVGGLTPDSDVLDIGCGSGRIAVGLTSHLEGGSYAGFDVVPSYVDWCRKEISSRFPHFRFDLAAIRNPQYNPRGPQLASEYRFPYADESFDIAIATSVFTHMRPKETGRYLEEAARTLRPGGRLLGTFFLLNEESARLAAAGRARISFDHEFSDDSGRPHWGDSSQMPEYALALRESDAREMHEEAGLRVETILYGSWPGRGRVGRNHDLVVARKVEAGEPA